MESNAKNNMENTAIKTGDIRDKGAVNAKADAEANKLENLELVDVNYENGGQKAILTFLDRVNMQVRDVSFNKQSWDSNNGAFVADPAKAKLVESWCKEYFDTTFADLVTAIGCHKDVYAYPTFSSLWPVEIIEKPDASMVGKLYQTTIKHVVEDGHYIRIRFMINNKTYESKMRIAQYVNSLDIWAGDEIRKTSQYAKFQIKFGKTVFEAIDGALDGTNVIVECKTAFQGKAFFDIKPLPHA